MPNAKTRLIIRSHCRMEQISMSGRWCSCTLGTKTDGMTTEFVTTKLNAPEQAISPTTEARGKHEPWNKLDRAAIKEHINSYHPAVSRYKLSRAPLRCYLEPGLTISLSCGRIAVKNTEQEGIWIGMDYIWGTLAGRMRDLSCMCTACQAIRSKWWSWCRYMWGI